MIQIQSVSISADFFVIKVKLKYPNVVMYFMANILIIQDDQIQQLMLKFFVQRFGYTPIIANGLSDALHILRTQNITLVLMDCCLQDASRFAGIARRFKSHVPLLMITGRCMKGQREQFLRAGMHDFLSKPFAASELRELLETWIARTSDASESA